MATRPISDIVGVWNQNSTFTGIGLNIKDTLSTSTSKLFNLQINSGSKFNVDKSGNVVAVGTITSNKFTASYARIGAAPITSQYTFDDNTTPNLYSNKIRAYSASFTYLEIISGSAPNSKMPVITDVEKIIAKPDQNLWIQGPGIAQGGGGALINQGIFFSNQGDYVAITCRNELFPSDGTVAVASPNINLGTDNGNGKFPISIENGAISFNPKNPNDCTDFNGCLNISGNFFVKGIKVGPNSLYLSSSLTDSRIHGTNLSISSSLISASRMHVGGKTKTSQYKFYDGSKPDLYVNKLRAYSGSFTSLEIISGSEGSMSIRNAKGQIIFESKADATGGVTKIGNDLAQFFSNDDKRAMVFPAFNTKRTTIEYNSCDIIANTSCSISGNFIVDGGTKWSPKQGIGDATGSLSIYTKDENGVLQALLIKNSSLKFDGLRSEFKNLNARITGSIYSITGGSTNYLGTHSIYIGTGTGKVTIDGTNAPIDLTQRLSGELFLNLGKTLIKTGTQSLWITGSTISGSKLNIYAPDFNSKINTYHITGSSGKFDSFKFNSITASSVITASSAGASSGKYAKIKIGNQTYKILLYADS